MAAHDNHPLPPPPGPAQNTFRTTPQEQSTPAQQYRPRQKSRTFSFRSDKSHKPNRDSHHHIDTHETPAEKEAKRLHTKADPTMAMNEAEPGVVQATVKSSLASIRAMQHMDSYGNPIAEPDRSNPTRSRWERPLDTIRSFEAAIDGGYSRKSLYRSDSESVANFNRRSSYYNNNGGRFPQEGYYGGRSQPASRPEVNQIDMRQGGMSRDSFYDLQQQGGQGGQGGYYNGNGHNGYNGGFSGTPPLAPPGRQRYSRMASEPQLSAHRQPQPDAHVYPIPNNHRSYETVASAAGSGSYGEPAGYQTDPTSSDNSSVERMQPPQKRQQEPVNDYGIGFTQNSTYQPPTFTVGANGTNGAKANSNQANGYQSNGYRGPPPAPPKDNRGSILRKPISQTLSANSNSQERPSVGEKRKSWFARRFSKQT